MADGDVLRADVELSRDAGPQVGAAAGELCERRRKERQRRFKSRPTTHASGDVPTPALTMLMKADRKTMTMVKTPTRVLLSRDRTMLLDTVCRGTGKSWEWGRKRGKVNTHSPVCKGGGGGARMNVCTSKLHVKRPHPKTAVHGGDEHDGHEDDETADEEAHHHAGSAERRRDWLPFFPPPPPYHSFQLPDVINPVTPNWPHVPVCCPFAK